jgi:hypothetical protein
MRGFYRGLVPALIQIAPHTGIQFWTYESLKEINFFSMNEAKDVVSNLEFIMCI